MNRFFLLFVLAISTSVGAVEIDCFRTNSAGAAYVIAESEELLTTPGEASSKITSFSFGDRTCALAVTSINRQNWVLVRGYWIDQDDKPMQGWLPLQSIAYRNAMLRSRNVRAQKVDVDIGDYFAEYIIKSGGAYSVVEAVSEHKCRKNEAPNEYGACEDFATVRGHIYGVGNFAVARSEKYGDSDVFKLREDGMLCPWQYGHMPEGCR